MNYQKIYDSIINRAKHRILESYAESHHIIPKCMGGINDKSNLVSLTAREHFLAHMLLAKMYGGKLWHAVHMMSNMKKYTSKKYEIARRQHAELMGEFRKNKKAPAEVKKKMSETRQGSGNGMFGKTHSAETKEKIRLTKIGRVGPKKGIPRSDETKRKISETCRLKRLAKEGASN